MKINWTKLIKCQNGKKIYNKKIKHRAKVILLLIQNWNIEQCNKTKQKAREMWKAQEMYNELWIIYQNNRKK